MFGSQVLDVAIALVLLYFVLATAASAVVEGCNQVLSIRAKRLEKALVELVTDAPDQTQGLPRELRRILNLGATKTNAAYVSASAFADAAMQLAGKIDSGPAAATLRPLRERLDALATEARGDLTTVKAGLETWFDDRMTDVQTQFKRYTTIFVFLAGLAITVAANASTVDVAQRLWEDSAAREAAVAAASDATSPADGEGACASGNEIADAACSVRELEENQIPLGWSADLRPSGWGVLWHLAGWLLTALLVMLGAPFWFDLLTRLVRARGSRAGDDPGSNRALLAAAPAGPPPYDGGGMLALYAAPPTPAPPMVDGEVDWLAVALNRTTPVPRPSP